MDKLKKVLELGKELEELWKPDAEFEMVFRSDGSFEIALVTYYPRCNESDTVFCMDYDLDTLDRAIESLEKQIKKICTK